MNHTDQAIVDAWILMHLAPQGSERHLQNFWAFDALARLCDTAPLQCLKVIDQICEANAGDVILPNLAAGPLEDVLTKHGELVIGNAKYQPICTAAGVGTGTFTTPLGGAVAGGSCIVIKLLVCQKVCENTCEPND